MEEREVVKAVTKWLEREGFRVYSEFLIDESGRPAAHRRPDLAEAEKHVFAWVDAHPKGIALVDLGEGLKDLLPRERVREVVDHLVKLWEVSVRQGLLYPGPVLHSGSFVNPCPVRPDLYGIRGKDRIERWAVECKGSRGDVVHSKADKSSWPSISPR